MNELISINLDEIACIEFKCNLFLLDYFIITLKSGKQIKVNVEQGITISEEYNKRKRTQEK